MVAGLPATLQAAKKPQQDPFSSFVQRAGDTVEDLRKKAVTEIEKQRAPEKAKPAAKKSPASSAKPTAKKSQPATVRPKAPAAKKELPSRVAEKPAASVSPSPSRIEETPPPKKVPTANTDITTAPDGAAVSVPKPAPRTPAPEPQTEGPAAGKKSPHGPPAVITTAELAGFDTLPEDRRSLIRGALEVAEESPWLPYKYGGSSPSDGGMDCSGAMYYVMQEAGLKPPRTSANQYDWLKENNRLHEVSADARNPDHASLSDLQPGDLLFWSGTYTPTDGRTTDITHVAMYLGKEKKGGRPVMINATDGRSYRGRQANGYGVYDFQVPKEGGRSRLVGFGTPPGVDVAPEPASGLPEEIMEP